MKIDMQDKYNNDTIHAEEVLTDLKQKRFE